ncbi:MAG: YhgE/Pip domain-containing protein [Olsenella sp.]|nr:YhgE/Pip domain-containing protein [Olsenella sp.]
MRNAFRIFWRDVKRICRNPVALIITLGVCIIPSLYAWFNILANWDPYKNTSDIGVAIVNQDDGATITGMGKVNAGDMVVTQLKKNKQLGWRFVGKSKALEGVRSGKYYAAIVIPDDFTSTLAGVIQGKTNKAKLTYYVNEKENAVAPKVTDTGATTIEDTINNTFAGTVAGVISGKIGDAATKALDGTAAGQSSVLGDIQTVKGSLDDLDSNLADASSTIDSARDTVASAKQTISDLGNVTSGISTKLDTATSDLKTARSDSHSLATRLNGALGSGTLALSNMSSTANYDVGELAGDAGWAQQRLDDAIAQLESALTQTQDIKTKLEYSRQTIINIQGLDGDSLTAQNEVSKSLETEIQYLVGMTDGMQRRIDALKSLSQDVKTGVVDTKNLSAAVNNAIQQSTSALSGMQSDLTNSTLPQVDSALDDFSDAASGVSSYVASMKPALSQLSATLDQLDQVLAKAKPALQGTRDSLKRAVSTLDGLESDITALQTTEAYKELTSISGVDSDALKSYFTAPVQLKTKAMFPVRNYGSGVTPFYTDLALWVGGFVLVAIFKREVDHEGVGDFKPWEGYVGRALLFVLLGEVQAVICCVGDLMLGIQCLHPVAFVVAGMVESFVYVNIIFSLSTAFKHIGMALGVILVILQIPGSSGTYPIEMMPGFFQALEPLLPFTYGNNAMREAIAGYYGNYFGFNIAVLLLAYMPLALLVGLGARRHLLNINALFDKRLRETDMMVSERYGMDEAHFKLTTIVKALTNSREYHRTFEARAAHFELMYPVLVRRGFITLIVVPVALNVLMFVLPFKMVLMTLWICSMIVICTFLIVVEYFHYRIGQKTHLSDMSEDELYDLLGDQLRQEFFAFAPIETMLIEKGEKNGRSGDDAGDGNPGSPSGGAQEPSGSDGAADDAPTASGVDQTSHKIGQRIGRLRTEFDDRRRQAVQKVKDVKDGVKSDVMSEIAHGTGDAEADDTRPTKLILNVTASLTGKNEKKQDEKKQGPDNGDATDEKGGDAR